MIEIKLPKIGTSDTIIKISDNYFINGDKVEIGYVICTLETSKASFDYECEHSGYIYFLYSKEESASVGDVFLLVNAELLTDSEFNDIKKSYLNTSIFKPVTDIVVTEKARKLIESNNLNLDLFKGDIINEKQVLEYLNQDIFDEYSFGQSDIVIIGDGGHARMCIDILNRSNTFNLVGYIDDNPSKGSYGGIKYFGSLSNLSNLYSRGLKNIILGIGFIGNLKSRDKLYSKLKGIGYNIPTIIHPSSIIEESAQIGEGCQIMAGSIIGSNVLIGDNCIINCGSIISHDCVIEDSCHMTPGSVLAGHVNIGKRVTIGMCATVYIGKNIESDTIILNGENIF